MSSVQLQLGFARTSQADSSSRSSGAAAGLSGKMGPGPSQARESVLILGEFNLNDALARPCVFGEDVQNERGPVNHLDVFGHRRFQDALLSG